MIDLLLTRYNYYAAVLLLGIGLYMLIESRNLVKKVIGMNVFQTGIFVFFISLAYVDGGSPAIVGKDAQAGEFVSPLPHVLILTAIVVGVALTAVALALVIRIYAEYGSLDETTIKELDHD
ncbi:MAG: cation:proton antiporter subunit C [Halapricum sp.]